MVNVLLGRVVSMSTEKIHYDCNFVKCAPASHRTVSVAIVQQRHDFVSNLACTCVKSAVGIGEGWELRCTFPVTACFRCDNNEHF